MVKNDYRRSLIMLRAHERGYSGHVRLEHRTLNGSMYFMISAPANGNLLCATLVRRDARGTYFAAKLGELRRDGRGQASLAYSFDPRNIDGHPLDDYLVLGIVERRPERCDLVLSGNVNGSQEVNWPAVSTAACYVCRRNQPSDCECGQPDLIEPRGAADDEQSAEPKSQQKPEEQMAEDVEPENAQLAPQAADLRPAQASPEAQEEDDEVEKEEEQDEEKKPDIDLSVTWPSACETLRQLFADRPVSISAPEDGYTYIEAPMAEETGYDSVLIGVRAQSGQPTAIAYALPSRFTAEPPVGLEDYHWYGGKGRGWWVIYLDAESGEALN